MDRRVKFGLFYILIVILQVILLVLVFVGTFNSVIEEKNIPFCAGTIIIVGGISIIAGAEILKIKEIKERQENRR